MDIIKMAKELNKMAKVLIADKDYHYIYDPEHKKHPGGGYVKTEKGWQKGKQQKEKNSVVKPKGVRKNFLQRIEKAIQKGDTLSFRYTKKDGTVEKLAIKPVVVFEVGDKTAVRGFKDGIEDKDHIRMVYINSMGGDKPYIPARRKNMLKYFNESQLVKLSQSNKIGDFELGYMAGHKSDAVRANAAKHPNCSAETLQKLSADKNETVLQNVASNPSANSYVLDAVAHNPNIGYAETYLKISRNPNVSAETINALCHLRSVGNQINNEWQSKTPKIKLNHVINNFLSGNQNERNRATATLFEVRDYKVAGKAKGKTPQELKADFIANMNPSKYASMESFKKAEQRIKKMSPSDLQAMFAAIMDEEEK